MTAKTASAASSAKHAATSKHTGTRKHTETAKQKAARSAASKKAAATRKANKSKVTAKAKAAAHAKALAIGDWLPVCSFEALAMSLRLAGQFVHNDEVAGLWTLAGAPPLGASVAAALDAASLHGLAGFRPQRVRVEWPGPVRRQDHLPLPLAEDEAVAVSPFENFLAGDVHGLILGIDRPGWHAVLATPRGWWSWGELYDPWAAAVDEAYTVVWS